VKLKYYLKLADQGLVETLGLCENVQTVIMGIPLVTEFKVIDPKERIQSYPALV
jgi:hypothetical protein